MRPAMIQRTTKRNRRGFRFTAMWLAVFMLAVAKQSAAQAGPPADLDAFVARSMKTFGVPGLAIAVVKDGKVVMSKGYGVRKMGESAPVDENTLFGIGSNTKAFTTAALASLVEGLRNRLQDVRSALARLERGVYGKCERCGKDIPSERLEAVRTARLCISCAQKR